MDNEIIKFDNLAHQWWDLEGPLKTLHKINPARMQFIKHQINLKDKKLLDIGCGGGILCESLAREHALVTGIDLAPNSIEVAKLHLYESNLNIDYRCTDIIDEALSNPEAYDSITCLELLEHVEDPELIIEQCAKLIKPGGIAFFSTINRNLASYILGVLVAEYVLKLVPRTTHDYKKFIKPADLQTMLNRHNFDVLKIAGMYYNPISAQAGLTSSVKVNYILSCIKR